VHYYKQKLQPNLISYSKQILQKEPAPLPQLILQLTNYIAKEQEQIAASDEAPLDLQLPIPFP
jgi:hypothetical protein